jgi:hypothetical protein
MINSLPALTGSAVNDGCCCAENNNLTLAVKKLPQSCSVVARFTQQAAI